MVPEQEDEAQTGGPGPAPRVSLGARRSAAARAVSAPRPERTAPRPLRLLPAAAAAPHVDPARASAPSLLPAAHPAPTPLLNTFKHVSV